MWKFFIGGIRRPDPPGPMNCLSWNCRGLGQPPAIPTLCELVRARRPEVIFLSETLAHRARIDEVKARLNFSFCFAVDVTGRSGGLCMLAKDAEVCSLIGFSNNHIDVEIKHDSGNWRLTGFYGYPERARRRESWNLLRRLSLVSSLPWMIIGDFNDLLSVADKKGRVAHPNWLFNGFRSAILDCILTDIPLRGYQFTWVRGRGTEAAVEERLDRAFGCPDWLTKFPNVTLTNLIAPTSDHSPILLKLEGEMRHIGAHKFRFENQWLREEGFSDLVPEIWNSFLHQEITHKLEGTADDLVKWARGVKMKAKEEKNKLEKEVEWLQQHSDRDSLLKLTEARKKLGSILLNEEIYWKQRAKTFWMKKGDKNTRFFHMMASTRRKTNKIMNCNGRMGLGLQKNSKFMK